VRQHKTKKNNRDQRVTKTGTFIWDAVLDLNMGKSNLNPGKPDSGIPRIPGRHFGLGMANAPECELCNEKTTTTFDLGGHGGDPCCPSCWADLYDLKSLPDDDENDLDSFCAWFALQTPLDQIEIADALGMERHGVNHTLDCGCVLTDLSNGEKYIIPCHIHMATTELKIVLTGDCNGCSNSFPESELTICGTHNKKAYILCPDCYSDWRA
tara:strand:+ start:2362 stop:2994 length:633 start_codon:yes stop_codon:yes gene_type:complete